VKATKQISDKKKEFKAKLSTLTFDYNKNKITGAPILWQI